MALNIKNDEADELVAALTSLTGETKTQATIVALRERLARERTRRDRKALVAEMLEIGRRCAAYGRHDTRPHGEFLYGDRETDPAVRGPRE